MDNARSMQVIVTTILRRGAGTFGSPIRIITQYWSMGGKLLAEVDPFNEERHKCRSLLRAWVAGCGDEMFSSTEDCRRLLKRSGDFLQSLGEDDE